MQQMTLGIDVACRAAHQASLADHTGPLRLWSARTFRTTTADLEALWSILPDDVRAHGRDGADAQCLGAARRVVPSPRGRVVLIPSEQSADLRDYYSKHTKSDRLDSRILARVPLLHPEGLRAARGARSRGVAPARHRLRSSLVKRRSAIVARLDALPRAAQPGLARLLRRRPGTKHAASCAPRRRLRRPAPVAAGQAGPPFEVLLAPLPRGVRRGAGRPAARRRRHETLGLWRRELDFGELADDIAVEARLALRSPPRSTRSSSVSPSIFRRSTRTGSWSRPRRRRA